MGVLDKIRKQIDLPIWEGCRFAPAVSSALSSSCSSENSNYHPQHGHYIYSLISATGFWRYDTWADSYLQLASPPIAPVTFSAMIFSGTYGVDGRVLSAGAQSVEIPGFFGEAYVGFDIRIIAGKGAGQIREITVVADVKAWDTGVASAVTNTVGTVNITDSTKAWKINEHAGRQVRIIAGSGVGQVRRVLRNSATVLYLGESVNSDSHDAFACAAPFSPAISATAGSQSMYQIESSLATVNSPWTVQPDASSIFRIESGTVLMLSGAAAAPFYTLQQYDVVTDTWYVRRAALNMFAVAPTDGSLEMHSEDVTTWDWGQATSGTTTTIVDSSKSWEVNQWAGKRFHIYEGAGVGQTAVVISNTSNTLTFAALGVAPDSTSEYAFEGFDNGIASSATTTTLADTSKSWTNDQWRNYAVKILYGTGMGQVYPILTNTSNTLTIGRSRWKTNPDSTSVYVIIGDPDKLYITLGANVGVAIHNLATDVVSFGRPVEIGWCSSSLVWPGDSSYPDELDARVRPWSITTLANASQVATATTNGNHTLRIGQTVVVRGATDALYNVTGAVVTDVPSATTFKYALAGTPTVNTLYSKSWGATAFNDFTKSWTNGTFGGGDYWTTFPYATGDVLTTGATGSNQGFVGTAGSSGGDSIGITYQNSAPSNNAAPYAICFRQFPGSVSAGGLSGTPTTTGCTCSIGGSFTGDVTDDIMTITVAPSTGRIELGMLLTGGSLPSGTTVLEYLTGNGKTGTYRVSTKGNATGSISITANWQSNVLVGKRVRFYGNQAIMETTITANSTTGLTYTATSVAPSGTGYGWFSVHETPARAVASRLIWCFGASQPGKAGRYIRMARGGAAAGFDRWDICTDRFSMIPNSPGTETLTTGSMYCYDGKDRIYFTKEATQRVYYWDIRVNTFHGAGQYPYAAGTAILGNRMEIFTTPEGLKYLWLNRHSNLECFRELLFF